MISGLRGIGLSAAYVSGYLRSAPRPDTTRLQGADAMHAWVLVWCGAEAGWIGLDPTNAIVASDEHVVLAIGRDYTDVDMRAYQLPKGGAGIDALVKVERPNPKPAYRQVLVKVAACSLNFRDLGIVRGTYRMPVREKPHSAVRRRRRGGRGRRRRHCASRSATRWPAASSSAGPAARRARMCTRALGGGIDGMLAEYAVLEEDGVVKIPAHLSFEEGATLPCAGVTAWHAMMEHAKLIAGQTVLCKAPAASRSSGCNWRTRWALQAIITSSSDEKLARAKKLGAACGINYKTTPELGQGGDGLHRRPRRRSRDRGRRRRHADALVRRHPRRRQDQLDRRLERRRDRTQSGADLLRRANVQGISVGSTQMFEAMNRAIAANGIKPVIDKCSVSTKCRRPTSTWLRARISARSSSGWRERKAAPRSSPPSGMHRATRRALAGMRPRSGCRRSARF
jgi:threonine dehydrogenase-like Zn-dependent dehydrogenase